MADICKNCGREQATLKDIQNDTYAGKCFTWYAYRDPDAAEDCRKFAAAHSIVVDTPIYSGLSPTGADGAVVSVVFKTVEDYFVNQQRDRLNALMTCPAGKIIYEAAADEIESLRAFRSNVKLVIDRTSCGHCDFHESDGTLHAHCDSCCRKILIAIASLFHGDK